MDFSREIEPDASVAGAFCLLGLFFFHSLILPLIHLKKKKSFSLVLMCHPLTSLSLLLPKASRRAQRQLIMTG